MEEKLKCPKCGSENVVEDDTYDISSDVGKAIYSVCGHCENCGVSLQWEEIYSLAGFNDIYVDDEEE